MRGLFRVFVNWRERRRQQLEREYQALTQTIEECSRENEICYKDLKDKGRMGGEASILALIRENNETMRFLRSRRGHIGRKLGYKT
jgi:hypothetical protein